MRRCKICNNPLEDYEGDICQDCLNNMTELDNFMDDANELGGFF